MSNGRGSNADDVLLRELNHRVKNNFQIIGSLISLKKRMVPPDHQQDLRFIEDHVLAMSVAYRLVYANGGIVDIPLWTLVEDVVDGLRDTAALPRAQVRVVCAATPVNIPLNQGIAVALYLAVTLPPYLDHALTCSGRVTVIAAIAGRRVGVTIYGSWDGATPTDELRTRLMAAVAEQLMAQTRIASGNVRQRIRFTLNRDGAV